MKLIALDLDGTLMSPDKTISQENIHAIHELQNSGNIVMICSGRAPEDIKALLNKYNLVCPVVGSNGTIVEVDNKIINNITMDKHDVTSIAQILDDLNLPYCFYTNKGIYYPSDWLDKIKKNMEGITNQELNRFTEKPQNSVGVNTFSNYQSLLVDHRIEINKLFILTFTPQVKEKLLSLLKSHSNITLTSSNALNVEIMHKDGHKGIGLRKMAEYYRIPIENTVAIGDNFNDLPMLQCAGYAIAMDNADNEVKKICDFVTLSNSENGVAHALRKLI